MRAVAGRGLCVLWTPWGPAPEPSTGTLWGLGEGLREGQAGPAELHSCPPVSPQSLSCTVPPPHSL